MLLCLAARVDAEEQPGEYVIAIERAVLEFRAGHWAEAAFHFERAHALHPSARTRRGLGLAYFENHQYVKALAHLRAAMSDTRMPLTDEHRRELVEAIANAEQSVARFKIALAPPTTQLRVDGSVVQADEGLLVLDPGEHELVASCEHFRTERRTVTAAPGRSDELTFALQPDEQHDDPKTTNSPFGRRQRQRIGAWLAMGVGGGGLVASVATGVLASKRHDKLEHVCRENVCTPDLRDTRSRGKTMKLATNILVAGGMAAVTGGLLWLLLTGRPEAPKVAAYCSAGGCSANIRMDF